MVLRSSLTAVGSHRCENARDLQGDMSCRGKHVAKKVKDAWLKPLSLRQLNDAATIKDVGSTCGTNEHPQMRSCISTLNGHILDHMGGRHSKLEKTLQLGHSLHKPTDESSHTEASFPYNSLTLISNMISQMHLCPTLICFKTTKRYTNNIYSLH